MDEKRFSARWYACEYLDGWMTSDDGLDGIASYISGWGNRIAESVAASLVGTLPKVHSNGDRIEFGQADVDRVSVIVRAQRAKRAASRPPVTMVHCGCGHTIPSTMVRHANFGTSCLDCYD